MEKILNDLGVEEVSTIGQFNPEFHEALMQIESTEHKSGNIVSVSTKGYTFRGKLLRAAKVSVAK
jgi:molecular chaperone GrpE